MLIYPQHRALRFELHLPATYVSTYYVFYHTKLLEQKLMISLDKHCFLSLVLIDFHFLFVMHTYLSEVFFNFIETDSAFSTKPQ